MKNFFYNISDILLAILIVAIASGVILWRMQIIMAYPDTIAAEINQQQVEQMNTSADSEADAAEDADAEDAEQDKADKKDAKADDVKAAAEDGKNAKSDKAQG